MRIGPKWEIGSWVMSSQTATHTQYNWNTCWNHEITTNGPFKIDICWAHIIGYVTIFQTISTPVFQTSKMLRIAMGMASILGSPPPIAVAMTTFSGVGFDPLRWLPMWWFQIFFIFTSKIGGNLIQFDEHIFQMGWFNHQLGYWRIIRLYWKREDFEFPLQSFSIDHSCP